MEPRPLECPPLAWEEDAASRGCEEAAPESAPAPPPPPEPEHEPECEDAAATTREVAGRSCRACGSGTRLARSAARGLALAPLTEFARPALEPLAKCPMEEL